MSDIKLLECPFCGQVGEIRKIVRGTYIGCYQPRCSDPECFAGTVTGHKQVAIAVWNKRSVAARESLRAENERLAAMLRVVNNGLAHYACDDNWDIPDSESMSLYVGGNGTLMARWLLDEIRSGDGPHIREQLAKAREALEGGGE